MSWWNYLFITCSGEFHLAFVEQWVVIFIQRPARYEDAVAEATPLLPALAHLFSC
jgi:hypothetical protein